MTFARFDKDQLVQHFFAGTTGGAPYGVLGSRENGFEKAREQGAWG